MTTVEGYEFGYSLFQVKEDVMPRKELKEWSVGFVYGNGEASYDFFVAADVKTAERMCKVKHGSEIFIEEVMPFHPFPIS